MIKTLTHYANVVAGGTNDKDVTPPNGKVYGILALSYSCPGDQKSGVTIFWNGTAMGDVQDASQHSKSIVYPPGLVLVGNGVKILKIRLTNTGASTVFLGCTILYEEV